MLLLTVDITLITVTPTAIMFVQLQLDAVVIGREIVVLDTTVTKFDVVELHKVITHTRVAPALEVAAA